MTINIVYDYAIYCRYVHIFENFMTWHTLKPA